MGDQRKVNSPRRIGAVNPCTTLEALRFFWVTSHFVEQEHFVYDGKGFKPKLLVRVHLRLLSGEA